jgi:hypothetical protein
MTTLGRSIINSRITNCRLRQARQDGLPLTESIRSSGSAPAGWSSAGWETSILVSVMPRQGDHEAPPICTGSPQRRWAFASSQWRTHGLFKAKLLRPNANNGDKQSNNNNASNQFFQLRKPRRLAAVGAFSAIASGLSVSESISKSVWWLSIWSQAW